MAGWRSHRRNGNLLCLGWAVLGWVGLGWAGLGWAGGQEKFDDEELSDCLVVAGPAAFCLAQHKNIINLSDPLAGQLSGENKPGKYTFILMCTEIKHVTCRVGGKYSYKSSSW